MFRSSLPPTLTRVSSWIPQHKVKTGRVGTSAKCRKLHEKPKLSSCQDFAYSNRKALIWWAEIILMVFFLSDAQSTELCLNITLHILQNKYRFFFASWGVTFYLGVTWSHRGVAVAHLSLCVWSALNETSHPIESSWLDTYTAQCPPRHMYCMYITCR